MTTFTSLQTLTAALSGSGNISIGTPSSARLRGAGTLTPSLSLKNSGGLILRGGRADLTGAGTLTATLFKRRPLSASLSGAGNIRLGEGAYAILPQLSGLSSEAEYASATGEMSALTGSSYDAAEVPEFGTSYGTLQPIVGMASEGDYGEVRATLAPLFGYSAEGAGTGFGVLGQMTLAYDSMTVEQVLGLAIAESISIADSFAQARIVPASMLDNITVTPIMSANGTFGATIHDTMQIVTATLPDGSLVAWVVHTDIRDSKGNALMPSTMYDAYGFTSMALFDGKYYGIQDDGIYELAGDTDAGAPIVAQLLLPKDDMGTEFKKQMSAVYAALQSNGDITVTVEVDSGQSYDYTLPATAVLKNNRAPVGRGLRSQYWQLTLTNADGADFTLDGTFLMAETMKRRL